MNAMDMQRLAKRWEEMGFVATKQVAGKTKWSDFYVYEGLFGSAYECDWLVDAPEYGVAHINDPHPEICKHLPKRG